MKRTMNDLWRYDGNWTWISGSSIGNQDGNYSTKGVSSPYNVPGSRHGSNSWIDNDGNMWLFCGYYKAGESILIYNMIYSIQVIGMIFGNLMAKNGFGCLDQMF
jgi:hypothetical protein